MGTQWAKDLAEASCGKPCVKCKLRRVPAEGKHRVQEHCVQHYSNKTRTALDEEQT